MGGGAGAAHSECREQALEGLWRGRVGRLGRAGRAFRGERRMRSRGRRSEDLEGGMLLGEGVPGRYVPCASIRHMSISGQGELGGGRARWSGTLRREGLVQGEGTPAGWGPPVVHMCGLLVQIH